MQATHFAFCCQITSSNCFLVKRSISSRKMTAFPPSPNPRTTMLRLNIKNKQKKIHWLPYYFPNMSKWFLPCCYCNKTTYMAQSCFWSLLTNHLKDAFYQYYSLHFVFPCPDLSSFDHTYYYQETL